MAAPSDFLAPFLPALPQEDAPRHHFASVAEFARAIPDSPKIGGFCTSGYRQDSGAWAGTKTLPEALALARDGWQDGAATVRALADRITLERPQRRRITRFDVSGAVPSVPRFLAGNPLNMRTHQRETSGSPIVTLVSQISAAASISEKTLANLAAAAAAIVDRLEDAGFRAEVIACRRSSNYSDGARGTTGRGNFNGARSEVAVIAKRAEDTLDIAALAFALGHPAMLRRLTFAYTGNEGVFKPSVGFGQGYSVSLTPLERPHGTYILPSAAEIAEHGADPTRTFDTTVAALRAQGCPGLATD